MHKKLIELPEHLGNSMDSLVGCTAIIVDAEQGTSYAINVYHRRKSVVLYRPYHFSFAANDTGWAMMCGLYFNEECLLFLQRLFSGVTDIEFTPREFSGAWDFGYPDRSICMGYGVDVTLSGLWEDSSRRSHSVIYMDDHPLYGYDEEEQGAWR